MSGDRRWPAVSLAHGESPAAAAARAVGAPVDVVAPRSAEVVEGALVVALEVRVDTADDARTPDPTEPATPGASRHRRVGAYAVVLDDARLLLTQLARDTPAPGAWTLPGGGIDPGESPLAAVLREVHEETAHELVAPALLDVDSTHVTGRAPSGRLEDFHGIGVIFLAGVREVLEPRVLDVGGSTAAAAWVPVDKLDGLRMSERSRARLARVLALASASGA